MDLNPYEQLGVQRDASTELIRRAYRAKSKTDHPDAGGDPEEWAKTSTALAVLVDPKKRQTFDETGRIEADRPNNDRAAALQIVEGHIGALVNAYPAGGYAPADDPRKMDVPTRVRDLIAAEIDTAEAGIRDGGAHVAYLKDVMSRFKLKNPADHPDGDPIVRGFKRQVDLAEQQIADLRTAIKVRNIAWDIAGDYAFERDKPEPDPYVWPASGISLSDVPSYPARTAAEWGDGT